MSTSPQKGNVQTVQVLKKNAHTFEHFLELEEPWHIRKSDLDDYEYHSRVEKLKSCSAVDIIGHEYFPQKTSHGTNRVLTYKLTERAKEVLKKALPDETLPCGKHRIHIDNPRRLDGLSCQYCREGPEDERLPVIEPEFSKEEVQELL